MRNPEPGPFGETLLEAKVRAITGALLVNSPAGGRVETVSTAADHRRLFALLLFVCLLATFRSSANGASNS
jgi:hypothetical protein